MDTSDYVYYDMMFNNYQTTNSEPPQLEFSETRNSPLINNANDYNLSIVRFQIDTPSLPAFIAQIQPNQNNVNLMIHSLTITYMNAGTETSPTNATSLLWFPVHKEAPTPLAPDATTDKFQEDSIYYYGYSMLQVCSILNTAFTTAMNTIKGLVAGLSSVDAPFIYFNETTKTFAIVAENAHFNVNNSIHLRIYFNHTLFSLLSSFPHFKYALTTSANRHYQILMDDERGYNLIQKSFIASNKIMIELHQEYSTLSNFSPVSSIVFTTSQIPISANALSAPLIFNNNRLVSDFNQTNLTAQIITDMANNEDFSYKPNLIYNPSAEYRRVSLVSNRPVQNIDIRVFWRDRFGKLKPFFIVSGGKASIKLLFEKKGSKRLMG